MTTPAPSPMTNPSRSLSNGLLAHIGSSDVLSAVSAANPPTPSGVMQLSVPPAIITSASPHWMERNASPIEWEPVAHAVTTLMDFPFAPIAMDTFPAAIFVISSGTRSGFILLGPFSFNFMAFTSACSRLPTPEPMETPTRYGSSFSMQRFASSTASFAAATAY